MLYSATAWRENVPSDFEAKLQSLKADEDVKQIVFGPEGSWVILWGSNGYSWEKIPASMAERLKALNHSKTEIKSVALAPNGGWVVLSGLNTFWAEAVPEDFSNALQKYQAAGEEIKQVAFPPV